MKKRVVSILIAGILFFSNIGVTSFAANNSAAESSSAASTEASSVAEEKENENAYGEEGISYFKITDFTDLPENISNQKVRVGGSLEDLELPDTLEVAVEADYEHDERIERGLAQERERLKREQAEQEEEERAKKGSSEDESDAAASEDSGEEIIFFDENGEEMTPSDASSELSDEETYEEEIYSGDTSTIEDEEAPTIDTPVEESTNSDAGSSEEVIDVPEEDTTESGAEESTEATSEESLVSWFKNTFRIPAVAYAADAKETKAQKEGVSIEQISDVEWILEPEYNNGVEEFVADKEGAIYLFTPVLLIPDTYYVEDELPIITVTVTDDFYAFDEKAVVDDVTIRVRADKGVFPEGSRVTAKKLAAEDEEKVNEVVDEQLDSESIVKEYTFDITIKDKEGYEVQPDTEKGRVVISFEAAEVADESLEAEVYHIIDEKEVEEEPEKTEAVALGGERAKERVLTIYNENSVLKAEKLEAEVVEFEDVKVLEAETTSFSSYTVVFKKAGGQDFEYILSEDSFINLNDLMTNLINASRTSVVNPATSAVEKAYLASDDTKTKKADDYIELETIEYDTNGPVINKGVYKKDANGEWCLIVKRPFAGSEKIKVDYKLNGAATSETYEITLTSTTAPSGYSGNNNYPYAVSLGDNTFELGVAVNSTSGDDIFQWQVSEDKVDTYDIARANTSTFGATLNQTVVISPSGDDFEICSSNWFRCLINGIPTEWVQIVTPLDDSRTWDSAYNGKTKCFVSNGKLAYTIYEDQTSPKKVRFDVVGEHDSCMKQTTQSGSGWRIFSNSGSSPGAVTYDQYEYNLDYLYFSFDKDNSELLHMNAKPSTGYKNFAIGANCQIGDVTDDSVISSLSGDNLEKLAILGIGSSAKADEVVNKGEGNEYAALLVKPITNNGVKYYFGNSYSQKPYPSTNTSKLEEKDLAPAIRLGWKNVSVETINVDFIFGGIIETGVKSPKREWEATGYYNSSTTSSSTTSSSSSTVATKSFNLTGSELATYTNTTETPEDNVKVVLKISKVSSTPSSVSSILPKYKVVSAVTSAANKSGTSSEASQTTTTEKPYTAENFDISITKAVNGASAKSVDEIDPTLQFVIDYNFDGKGDVQVFRTHKEQNTTVSKNLNSTGDGSYVIDRQNGKIYVYSRKFSTFTVAYQPETYRTVTFNDGTNKWTVKVKSGEKVSAPESMPTNKEGVTAQYWYKGTSTSSTKPTAYDFNTPVTADMTLTAYYGKTYTVKFEGISPTITVQVAEGGTVSKPADPVKEGYTFKGWYSDKTAKTLYNFDTPVTKDLTLYAGFVNGEGKDVDDDEDGDVNGARAARTNDTLPPVWLWVLILVSALVVFSCNLYSRAKEGKVKFSNNKTVRKVTRFFLLVGLVIVTVFKFLARKVNEKRRDLALAVSGVVVLIAAGVLIVTSLEYHRSERTYENANKTFVQETQQLPVVTDKTETVNAENTVWWDEASVEMDTLSEEYPDVIGWIYFENEDISYPIMYSGDNTKYLSTSYNGEKAKAGAIFLDGESTPDFSDPHSLIYGHNMRDLSMFGKLRYYKTDASYYDEHQYFQVFTKDGVYRYQIFAYEEVPDNHDVFWVYGKNPEGMWEMLQDIEGGSYRQTGIEATEADHVITLATCTSKEDRRLIVSAVRTDEHDYEFVASN